MELSDLALKVGELTTLVGSLGGVVRWVTNKIGSLDHAQAECDKKIAVLQNIAQNVGADHDKLILVEAAAKAAHQRLDDKQ